MRRAGGCVCVVLGIGLGELRSGLVGVLLLLLGGLWKWKLLLMMRVLMVLRL